MVERDLLAHVTRLTDAASRPEAAARLAAYLGVDELFIFVRDPEIGLPLPAPGFPRTLPDGRRWQEFLAGCTPSAPAVDTLPCPSSARPARALGLMSADGAILVLLGGNPAPDELDALRLLLPLLSTTFAGEYAASVAASNAALAEQAAANARRIAESLAAARRQLSRALGRAEAARRDLSFLAELSETLTSSLDLARTVRHVTAASVPYLGECSIAAVRAGEAEPLLVAASSVDPALDSDLQRLEQAAIDGWPVGSPLRRVLERGCPEIIEVEAFDWLPDPGDQPSPTRGALAPASLLIVPLPGSERVRGVLGFISRRATRGYTTDDLPLAQALARRAALAIDNAVLYRGAQQAIQIRNRFLTIASHELRTPVTILQGHAQLLLRQLELHDTVDPRRLERALAQFEHQSDKLNRLIAQLLDISRIETGQLLLQRAPADVSALVESVVRMITLSLDRHTIRLESPQGVRADVDTLRLEQVITNLIDNAAKYSPAGGEIVVAVEQPDSARVAISVTDHGIGIAPDVRQRIFERFFQAHDPRAFGGMGLGLYVSQQIVRLHGGRILVESRPDAGTRFTVELPARQVAPEPAAAIHPAEHVPDPLHHDA